MTTTTPAARLARLLAEGARILAVQGNDGGIDVTHDIQGLLAELQAHEDKTRLSAISGERADAVPPAAA